MISVEFVLFVPLANEPVTIDGFTVVRLLLIPNSDELFTLVTLTIVTLLVPVVFVLAVVFVELFI